MVSLLGKVRKGLKQPRLVILYLREKPLHWTTALYNGLLDLLAGRKGVAQTEPVWLDEVRTRSRARTDISDHLVTLFAEALSVKPRLIVELGVRGGESTYVLERVARFFQSQLVSVDLEDCSRVSTYENWHFVRGDDVAFAGEFSEWCSTRRIHPQIDLLFIDTSHLFGHTLNEIRAWLPLVSGRAKVFFHDTNLKKIYFRQDGSMGIGWRNQRGVIRAIEKYLNRNFDEKKSFIDFSQGWIVRHSPYCGGFTVLEKSGVDLNASRQSDE